MESLLLVCICPILGALATLCIKEPKVFRKVFAAICWAHICAVAFAGRMLLQPDVSALTLSADFVLTRIGALFILLTGFVVACSLTHADAFFEREQAKVVESNAKNERLFYLSTSGLLLTMTFVFLCDNLGFLWISIEGTTLSSAALVYFSRTKHALEATWKYLMICSVGIAFALFGTILIFASSQHSAVISDGSLSLITLTENASQLQYSLLRLGYIFCLLGYGTKAGIFPLHSWLPDAYSEAPAPASAMLSGALTNCALFSIWRISQLVSAAHHGSVATILPLTLGAITVVAASLFLVHQHGIKKLWAYSSIENVGLMMVAIGLGSGTVFFLQALNHSFSKTALFLLSGNIIQATGTKRLADIKGILKTSPTWGILFALGALSVTGAPPFGAFISEWMILIGSSDQKLWWIVGSLIFGLALSFIAVSVHVSKILFGTPKKQTVSFHPLLSSIVPAILLALTMLAGLTAIPFQLVHFL